MGKKRFSRAGKAVWDYLKFYKVSAVLGIAGIICGVSAHTYDYFSKQLAEQAVHVEKLENRIYVEETAIRAANISRICTGATGFFFLGAGVQAYYRRKHKKRLDVIRKGAEKLEDLEEKADK